MAVRRSRYNDFMNPYHPPQENMAPQPRSPSSRYQTVIKICFFAAYAMMLLFTAVFALLGLSRMFLAI
jgi:hypothetical protein